MHRGTHLAVITDPLFVEHAPPGFHPERPQRLAAAQAGAERVQLPEVARVRVAPREATVDELARAHDFSWLELLGCKLAAPSGYLDADTYYNAHTAQAARLAAGSACAMVESLLAGETDLGVLLARPPGHHATRTRAMGFCVLNNVAVAAAHALARGARRVAIVDWDVHHGNGTQDIFFDNPAVLFVSLHESPLYPDTGYVHEVGGGDARGRTVNLPLPAGSDGGSYALAFERVVLPILKSFAPDLVLISAGYDAHQRDPLANMQLDDGDYGWMAAKVRDVARATANGRVGVLLEGGYDLTALENSVEQTIIGLARPEGVARPSRSLHDASAEVALRAVVSAQRPFWPELR